MGDEGSRSAESAPAACGILPAWPRRASPPTIRVRRRPADRAASAPSPRSLGLLGVGLDGKDGHTRITKGDDFVLYGGSAETHEKMQDFTIRLTEKLQKKGKRIRDADPRELRDIAGDLES